MARPRHGTARQSKGWDRSPFAADAIINGPRAAGTVLRFMSCRWFRGLPAADERGKICPRGDAPSDKRCGGRKIRSPP
jgi:hypothetical protein